MTRIKGLFGLPILGAVAAGIIFPYTALTLMPFGFVLLFLLMLFSGFTIDWRRVPPAAGQAKHLCLGLTLMFLVFPLLQLLLAKALIDDTDYLAGIAFASLMPAALVAPYFTKEVGGDEEFSFILMVLSMLLAPVISPALLKLFTASFLPVQTWPLIKSMLLLVTAPLAVSYVLARFAPRVRSAFVPHLGVANMAALSLLVFILFGNAAGRLNLHYEFQGLLWRLLVLAFFQDFGVLFLTRFMLCRRMAPAAANGLMVSLSMKNVAIAAGILLFYDPRASLAPALVFIAHAFLFSFLPAMAPRIAIGEKNRDQGFLS